MLKHAKMTEKCLVRIHLPSWSRHPSCPLRCTCFENPVFLKSFVMSFGGRSRSCRSSSCLTMLDLFMFSFSSFHVFFQVKESLPITARSVRHFGGAGWCVMNFMSFWAAIHLHKWLWSCSMQTSSLKPWVPPCKMRYSTCPKVIQETKRKIYKAINKCIQNILNQQISKAITEILEQFNIHSTMKLPFAYTGVCRGGASVALLHVKPCPRSGRRAMQWRQSCHELPLKQYRLDGNAIESCRCSSCC